MSTRTAPRRNDLLYPKLSYKIIGILFDVYNELGPGHKERYYQRAVAKAFANAEVSFKEEVSFPLHFQNEKIGSYRLDFLIENKIILELKRDSRHSKQFIRQVLEYLNATGINLAILASFNNEGLLFKRLISRDLLKKSADAPS